MAETVAVRNMRLVNPQGATLERGPFRLSPRPESLAGKTLGLMENRKANSDKVLYELGSLLKDKYELRDVVYLSKHHASLPPKPDVVQEALEQVDVLITGVGD